MNLNVTIPNCSNALVHSKCLWCLDIAIMLLCVEHLKNNLIFSMLSSLEDYSEKVGRSIIFHYHQKTNKIYLLYIYNEINFQYMKL